MKLPNGMILYTADAGKSSYEIIIQIPAYKFILHLSKFWYCFNEEDLIRWEDGLL